MGIKIEDRREFKSEERERCKGEGNRGEGWKGRGLREVKWRGREEKKGLRERKTRERNRFKRDKVEGN